MVLFPRVRSRLRSKLVVPIVMAGVVFAGIVAALSADRVEDDLRRHAIADAQRLARRLASDPDLPALLPSGAADRTRAKLEAVRHEVAPLFAIGAYWSHRRGSSASTMTGSSPAWPRAKPR